VPVPDNEITPLMCALHEHVRDGATLAVALYEARQQVDPYDPATFPAWCAFTAFGAG
jgi:hypothetical protein